MKTYTIESVAFEGPNQPDRGYTVKGLYLKDSQDALIQVMFEGKIIREFLFPAYKIWNIPAHFKDIVDGELENNPSGYEMAAWDGITGATFIIPAAPPEPSSNQTDK